MKVVGILFLILGILWTILNLLKQPQLVSITKENIVEKGYFRAIFTYVVSEIFGLWPSLALTYFGLMIILPSALNIFITTVSTILFFIFLAIFGLI